MNIKSVFVGGMVVALAASLPLGASIANVNTLQVEALAATSEVSLPPVETPSVSVPLESPTLFGPPTLEEMAIERIAGPNAAEQFFATAGRLNMATGLLAKIVLDAEFARSDRCSQNPPPPRPPVYDESGNIDVGYSCGLYLERYFTLKAPVPVENAHLFNLNIE